MINFSFWTEEIARVHTCFSIIDKYETLGLYSLIYCNQLKPQFFFLSFFDVSQVQVNSVQNIFLINFWMTLNEWNVRVINSKAYFVLTCLYSVRILKLIKMITKLLRNTRIALCKQFSSGGNSLNLCRCFTNILMTTMEIVLNFLEFSADKSISFKHMTQCDFFFIAHPLVSDDFADVCNKNFKKSQNSHEFQLISFRNIFSNRK